MACDMDDVGEFSRHFWQGLSLLDLLGFSVLGLLAGLVAGGAWWWWMQRRGWLARGRRWHHWVIASYALLLPLGGMLTGGQLGFAVGAQRALYKQLDHFEPQLQTLTEATQRRMLGDIDEGMLVALQSSDVVPGELAQVLVADYLERNPLTLQDMPAWMPDALGAWALGRMRGEVLMRWLDEGLSEALADTAASYTGVDMRIWREVLHMRLGDLLQARGLIRLAKAQIAALMPGIYIGMLVPLLVLMALVMLELWLARRHGWHRAAPVAHSASVEPASAFQ